MDRITQTQKVLEYMKSGHTITSWEAIQKFHATRLSDIIFRLRHGGHEIITHKERSKDGTNYARYELIVGEE